MQLAASALFTTDGKQAHRLHHQSKLHVDLIPFGGVEQPDGTIVWPPGNTVMGVLGYTEARVSAIEVCLPDQQSLKVVTLPMLSLLKLLAWADRHLTAPRKDAIDFLAILDNYLDAEQANRLYEDVAYLLNDDAFDYRLAGAWLAGKDAKEIIEANSHRPEHIKKEISIILIRESNADGPLYFVGQITEYSAEETRKLLLAFLAGFSGVKSPFSYQQP